MTDKEFQKILEQIENHEKRIRALEVQSDEKRKKRMLVVKEDAKHIPSKAEFSKNPRAFFKQYVKKMTGRQKFVLVIAFLVKGKPGVDILFNKIEKMWNKHSGLLGGKLTSRIYGTRAKEKEWLDSPKNGVYKLTKKWTGIFS